MDSLLPPGTSPPGRSLRVAPGVARTLGAGALCLAAALCLARVAQSTLHNGASSAGRTPLDLAVAAVAAVAAAQANGSGVHNASSAEDALEVCVLKGAVWSVWPRKFLCTAPPQSFATADCAMCGGEDDCHSPVAALHNLKSANASEPFVGWHPQPGEQGGGAARATREELDRQSVTLELPGPAGQIVRALLWANAGDVEHDPEWVKVWSSDDGSNFQLRDVLNVTSLRGDSNLTVLPLVGDSGNWRALPLTEESNVEVMRAKGLPGNLDAGLQVRARFWRVNPGGIPRVSTPRTIGLCATDECTNCAGDSGARYMFMWSSDSQLSSPEPASASFPPSSLFP